MRIRIDLSYDGTAFSGWARQPGRRTVQGVIEATIAQVLRLETAPATVCAGRTDAGVHARGQVIHADLPDQVSPSHAEPLVTIPTDSALNQWFARALPDDITIRRIQAVSPDFDARFSALNRRYCYRLWDDRHLADPLTRGFTVTYPQPLAVPVMAEAARQLLGLHDFVAFCRPKDHGTCIRTLLHFGASRLPNGLIEVSASADAFCHSMVRSLVGALCAVGRGQRDQEWLRAQLHASKRANDITVMPAHGLTLEEVSYPPDDELAARARQARARRDRTPDPDEGDPSNCSGEPFPPRDADRTILGNSVSAGSTGASPVRFSAPIDEDEG